MDFKEITKKIQACCDGLGTYKLRDLPLETVSPVFLEINDENLTDHLAAQPSLTAFFNNIKKQTERALRAAKAEYDSWYKKKYLYIKEAHSTSKLTIAELEGKLETNYAAEIAQWRTRINEAQEMYDTLDVYCEALKHKAFALKEYVHLAFGEYASTNDGNGENEPVA